MNAELVQVQATESSRRNPKFSLSKLFAAIPAVRQQKKTEEKTSWADFFMDGVTGGY
jgi:hypothetical protein